MGTYTKHITIRTPNMILQLFTLCLFFVINSSGSPAYLSQNGTKQDPGTVLQPGSLKQASHGAVLVGGWEGGVESYPCSVSVPELPTLLRSPASTVLDGRMHVCGGWNIDHEFYDECLVLDQYGTAWEPASSMNVARNEHGLDAVGENLVATGGYGEERFLDTVEVFNGDVWELSEHKMEPSRCCHCSVAISDTEVIVIGGQTFAKPGSFLLEKVGNIDKFEVGKGWTNLGEIYPARFGHACVKMGNEIVISGGSVNNNTVEAMDLDTMEFRRLPDTIQKRWDHTMELIDDELWVFGGMWTENLYSGERFNGIDWNLEELSQPHQDSSSAVLPCQ